MHEGQAQPLMVVVSAAAGEAAAGNYSGVVRIIQTDGTRRALDLRVVVWDDDSNDDGINDDDAMGAMSTTVSGSSGKHASALLPRPILDRRVVCGSFFVVVFAAACADVVLSMRCA